MHVYTDLLGIVEVPTYGLLITAGIVVANIIAAMLLKRFSLDFNDLVILEAYGLLGGFVGAKALYIAVSFGQIEWNRIFENEYFSALMQNGFVFYGGLIGGIALVFFAGAVHKIDAGLYLRRFVFLVPLVHSFGRAGCFMVGCCYGVPYEGIGKVAYPEGYYAPAGMGLFPVQLLEAACLLLIAALICGLQLRIDFEYSAELYLVSYGLLRFALEYLRYDGARGYFAGVSTSQWISVFMVAAAAVVTIVRTRRRSGALKSGQTG